MENMKDSHWKQQPRVATIGFWSIGIHAENQEIWEKVLRFCAALKLLCCSFMDTLESEMKESLSFTMTSVARASVFVLVPRIPNPTGYTTKIRGWTVIYVFSGFPAIENPNTERKSFIFCTGTRLYFCYEIKGQFHQEILFLGCINIMEKIFGKELSILLLLGHLWGKWLLTTSIPCFYTIFTRNMSS